jgi:CheY-like chemotaxis protein
VSDAKPIRVLVVEDSPDDEELVILELRRGGYAPVHERVESEAEMRAALERGGWDIVISDHALPGFSGPAALALLQQTGRDIPFIIVSGTVGEEAAVAAVKAGANDYVLKSNTVRLCTAVEREVREAKRRAEQRRMSEQLLIQDRMAAVGTLAAGVAHENNNPLTAVLANLELVAKDIEELADELNLRSRMRAILEELTDARESADRLRHIVRDLRTFSRVSDEERRGPVNVQRVVESSLRLALNEIRHRARLVKEFESVPPVDANEATVTPASARAPASSLKASPAVTRPSSKPGR